eukprot:Rmarinus@m.10744
MKDEESDSYSDDDSRSGSSYTYTGSYSDEYSSSGTEEEENERNQGEEAGWTPFRRYVKSFVDSRIFSGSVLTVIFLNTILIALQTDINMQMQADWYMAFIDNIFLGIYVFELILKLYVLRKQFFENGWNNFDAFVVVASFLDYLQFIVAGLMDINPKILRILRVFRAVRAIRALRVLRTITFLKNLQIIVTTLLKSIPAMGSIILMLFLVLYVFAIIGVYMYGDAMPDRFGSIGAAIFALFQLITLDDWFEYMDTIYPQQPSVFFYLFLFIVLETFIFINLFVAVIVSNLEASQDHGRKHSRKRKNAVDEEGEEETSKSEETTLHRMPQKTFENYYPDPNIPKRQKELMTYYFMLLASYESTFDMVEQRHRALDELIDITVTAEERESMNALGGGAGNDDE